MDWRVQTIIHFLESNLHRDIPLTEMARIVGLSSSRLRHIFKAQTDVTPTQYLNRLRMRKAKEKLETTSLSVKEIMVSAGVSDPSNFMRAFKRAYGVTPTQFRSRRQCEQKFTDIARFTNE